MDFEKEAFMRKKLSPLTLTINKFNILVIVIINLLYTKISKFTLRALFYRVRIISLRFQSFLVTP